MRGATLVLDYAALAKTFQSTHPMRGATTANVIALPLQTKFQSTHPMRGATRFGASTGRKNENFNPRTPCGVRRIGRLRPARGPHISIHAPHAGCDFSRRNARARFCRFQSTHPMRGATCRRDNRTMTGVISIHAPHAGCDLR